MLSNSPFKRKDSRRTHEDSIKLEEEEEKDKSPNHLVEMLKKSENTDQECKLKKQKLKHGRHYNEHHKVENRHEDIK